MQHKSVLLAVLCLVAQCSSFKILCLLPYPGKSHQMVFEPLLQELTDRGHELTVVSFFPKENPEKNRRDISLLPLGQPYVEVVNLKNFEIKLLGLERYVEHAPLVMNLARSNLDLCERVLNFPEFQEFIRAEGKYDLIIVELFNSDCMLGVIHKYGIPFVGLMSSTILPWTPERLGFPDNPAYVPGMTLRVTNRMSFLERVENTFFLYFYQTWFRWQIRPKEQMMLERKFGKLPDLEEVAKNASVVLVNTHHSLNGVKALVPAFVEVGGLHLYGRSVQPLPSDLQKFINGSPEGVILVSFGSLIRSSTMPRHRLRAFLKVIARLRHRVIWKWEADIEDVPENVLVMKWVPQYDVLHHPKCVAFISHGGLLSMTEAVDAGVPMLVIPVLGDQFGNAAHAQAAGLATVLHYTDIDENSLMMAVERVLKPEIRASAKQLNKIWHDRESPPLHTAAFWVERTARLGNTSQLAGESRRMPAYQLLLADVLLFAAFIVGITLLLLYYVLSKLIRIVITYNKVKLS